MTTSSNWQIIGCIWLDEEVCREWTQGLDGLANLHRCLWVLRHTFTPYIPLSLDSGGLDEDDTAVPRSRPLHRPPFIIACPASPRDCLEEDGGSKYRSREGASLPSLLLKSLREFLEDSDLDVGRFSLGHPPLRFPARLQQLAPRSVGHDGPDGDVLRREDTDMVEVMMTPSILSATPANFLPTKPAGARANDTRFDDAASLRKPIGGDREPDHEGVLCVPFPLLYTLPLTITGSDPTPDALLRNRPSQEERKKPKFAVYYSRPSLPYPLKAALHENARSIGRNRAFCLERTYEDRNGGISGSKDLGSFGVRRKMQCMLRVGAITESVLSHLIVPRSSDADTDIRSSRIFVLCAKRASQRDRAAHEDVDARTRSLVSLPTRLLGPYLPFLRAELAIGRDRVPSPATSEDRAPRTRGVMRTGDGTGAGGGGTGRGKDLDTTQEDDGTPSPPISSPPIHRHYNSTAAFWRLGEASRRLGAIVYDE
ncbi:hypothetical protein B0H16DRAFT_1896134 [Mycena metata]|uniref:Uncharacterized protein n=1 Tax=Mycena metata TaxID=1033252 RepID=A0AAD7HK86_9AGAR|nr:hypothetical protein B0H16DRAFT_1896134 [Mycena metata]